MHFYQKKQGEVIQKEYKFNNFQGLPVTCRKMWSHIIIISTLRENKEYTCAWDPCCMQLCNLDFSWGDWQARCLEKVEDPMHDDTSDSFWNNQRSYQLLIAEREQLIQTFTDPMQDW